MNTATVERTGVRPRRLSVWWAGVASLLALFMVVAGARWWLVQAYSTSLPFSDQWDGEALNLLKPWTEGQWHWQSLFLPHNEHRIVLTRLLLLALFAVNGQWDPQLEMAVNAGLCGVFAVLMTGTLIRVLGAGWRWPIWLGVGIYAVLPFGWENTLGGFQSQNSFLIIFSLAAIWGLGLHRAGSTTWWVGLAGLVLACLSMGSGFLAAAAVLGLLTVREARGLAAPGGREWLTAVACAGVVALGWVTRVVVPGHAVLRAATPAAFASALGRFLAWPLYGQPAWVFAMLAPLGILTVVYLWKRPSFWDRWDERQRKSVELLLTVGGWGTLQTAALAYARDGHGAPPACRYMDLLAIMPLTNFLAAGLLLTMLPSGRRRWICAVAALAWLGLLSTGFWLETDKDFRGWLPNHLAEQSRGEENVRGYLATKDSRRYLLAPPPETVPFPVPARLANILDDETVRAFLPADVRAPLEWRAGEESKEAAFVPEGVPPKMAVVPFLPCRGSYPGGEGTWRARVVEASAPKTVLPYLRFRFAGDLGEPGLSFALRDGGKQRRVEWRPTRVPHEHWRVDYIHRPGTDLWLEATDARAGKWFAFTAPVEVGAWSYWAGYVLRRGGWVFAAGMALALAALAGGLWRN